MRGEMALYILLIILDKREANLPIFYLSCIHAVPRTPEIGILLQFGIRFQNSFSANISPLLPPFINEEGKRIDPDKLVGFEGI